MSKEVELLDYIKNKLAVVEDLRDCKIELYDDSKKGEGMVAVIRRLIFKGNTADNQIETKNMVLKIAPTHSVHRLSCPIHEMYLTEIYAYETILPTLRKISEDFDIDFVKYPQCHIINNELNEEYLLLEDLKAADYRMWNNKNIMDDSHIFLVLENLAKFHAPSFYLKQKNTPIWEKLTKNFIDVSKKFFWEGNYCDAVVDMARGLDKVLEDDKYVLERFSKYRDEELKYFMGQFCSGNDPDFVIVHGDIWSNNIMFKYEDTSDTLKPTDLAFLDFQGIRHSSIALDLSIFFYTCATKEVMDSVDSYLSYYYQKLSEILTKMAIDPERTLPYSSLLFQWKKYNKFGLTMALGILHGVTSDSEEFPSLEDVIKSGKPYWFALNFQSKHKNKYHQRIKDVIVHFVNKKYI